MNVTFDVTIGEYCGVLILIRLTPFAPVGVGIIWGVLRVAATVLTERLGLNGFQSGQYGNPPRLKYWARQASVYILAVIIMKLAILALLALVPPLMDFGEWLLSWTGGNTSVQIIL